jgi:AcrR family transcriptional regulator
VKTRERILAGALALFNEEGATTLTALDVATALGMSPGHLYYHFKGKAELTAALFDAFEGELALVLEGALADLARPEAGVADLLIQVQIVLEEVHDVRFLFREAGALSAAFPALAPRYRRTLAALRGASASMLAALAARGEIAADMETVEALSRALVLGLAFKLAQLDLEGAAEPPRALIARAAAEVVAPVLALAA